MFPFGGQSPRNGPYGKNLLDRQLRSAESYSGKWAYVQNNPMRHRLVNNFNDGQYKGEMNIFHWHDE